MKNVTIEELPLIGKPMSIRNAKNRRGCYKEKTGEEFVITHTNKGTVRQPTISFKLAPVFLNRIEKSDASQARKRRARYLYNQIEKRHKWSNMYYYSLLALHKKMVRFGVIK